MELQQVDGQAIAGGLYDSRRLVDEEADDIDKGRYPTRQLGCPLWRHIARTGRVQNEADGSGARGHGRIDIRFAGQAANFDSCHSKTSIRKVKGLSPKHTAN